MLKGKVAIVTGSTSGIGLGIAEAFAGAGASIVLNGFGDAAEIEATRSGVASRHGVKVTYSGADMSKPAAISGMVADAILAINLSSAFHATKAVLPGMKQRKWGRIINVASAHGLVASAFKSAYVAAKHGVVGLTKVTAMETAEDGITCNAICPGYVWTPLVQKQIPEQAKAHGMSEEEVVRKVLLANQPNKRFATVEEMGALAVFLCSQGAASMTGTALPVDGGWTAH